MKMLRLKINNVLSFSVIGLAVLLSGNLFAQSEKPTEESTIVMTKAELSSFLNSVAEARRAQIKAREDKQQKGELNELRLKYQERPSTQPSYQYQDNSSNQQILAELRYLNERINNLSANANRPTTNPSRDNTTIVVPGSAAVPYYYNQPNPVQGSTTTTVIPSNTASNERIKQLEARIDLLRNAKPKIDSIPRDNSLNDSLNTMKGSLSAVRRQMDSLEAKMIAANKLTVKENDDEGEGEKTYFKQEVFFGNNSETLEAEYYTRIKELTQILIQYPEAKILLEGWASPTGKLSYNKELSMRRAEA
ncbi:MAG: OmpA family protein, partial [Leeuwenhoekiella sp.]